MPYTNVFSKPNQNLSSSENTRYKRQKTIFKGAIDVAEHGGKLIKKTKLGKNMGTYVGDIYTTTTGNKLLGAKNYEALYDVTIGKYLADPLAFGIANGAAIWEGSIYVTDLSGIVNLTANITSGKNFFYYPPDPNATLEYPPYGWSDVSNNQQGGLFIDPERKLFYPSGYVLGGALSGCARFDELSYLQNVTYQQAFYKRFAIRYPGVQHGIISPVIYPAAHLSLKCDKNWVTDISNGVIWNGYVPGYKRLGAL
jgi:hypothetical protein